MNRDVIARRLQWDGHHVVAAADGAAGLAMALSEQPEIVLLDMGLPKVSGWDVARRLKASAATSAVPIIALTAYAFNEDRDRALDAGCDAHMSKPVDYAALFATIRRLLAARQR